MKGLCRSKNLPGALRTRLGGFAVRTPPEVELCCWSQGDAPAAGPVLSTDTALGTGVVRTTALDMGH